MSTATKLPDTVDKPPGPSMVVVRLCVSERACVSPVALSKRDQEARYVAGPFATPAATAAFSNVNRLFASRRGATMGLIAFR